MADLKTLAMKASVFALSLVLPVLWFALTGGCGSEYRDNYPLVACSDLPDNGTAELTAAPSFSAAQIAPGDPLAITVPVNEHTAEVHAYVRSMDRETGVSFPSRETGGAETVVILAADTDVLPGVYLAWLINLTPTGSEPSFSYSSRDPDATYELVASIAAEAGLKCVTDIPVAAFTVVSER